MARPGHIFIPRTRKVELASLALRLELRKARARLGRHIPQASTHLRILRSWNGRILVRMQSFGSVETC